jgi:hypothetical protein
MLFACRSWVQQAVSPHLGRGHKHAVSVLQQAATAKPSVFGKVQQAVAENRLRACVTSHALPLGCTALFLEQIAQLLSVEDFDRRNASLARFL